MAKATFNFEAPKEITKTEAQKIAEKNDANTSSFNLDAEDDEELTLTGKFFESVWTRKDEGKADTNGSSLMAQAKRATGETLNIPFGLFRSAKRLASGGEIINCKAKFGKHATASTILDSVKNGAKVKVVRYYYFREGYNNESETTKVL